MENQSTTNAAADSVKDGEPAGRASKLGELIRTRVAEVKAQLDASQARAREKLGQSKLAGVQGKVVDALQTAMSRVKSGLDLPSRSEVASLAQRIEELDKKLADYETRTAAGKGKKKADGDKSDWA